MLMDLFRKQIFIVADRYKIFSIPAVVQSYPKRFKMLSLYAILILTVTSSVFGEQSRNFLDFFDNLGRTFYLFDNYHFILSDENCQSGDDSICEIPDMPMLRLNPCCDGYECVALEGGDGTKFCMEKNATVLALNESCKVSINSRLLDLSVKISQYLHSGVQEEL